MIFLRVKLHFNLKIRILKGRILIKVPSYLFAEIRFPLVELIEAERRPVACVIMT